MNHVIKIIKEDGNINIVCHTDGEPENMFWVWELTGTEIEDWFGYRYGIEDFTRDVATDFINDDSILEDSDDYNCGKAPIYGCWYAPLTIDQIEQIF